MFNPLQDMINRFTDHELSSNGLDPIEVRAVLGKISDLVSQLTIQEFNIAIKVAKLVKKYVN